MTGRACIMSCHLPQFVAHQFDFCFEDRTPECASVHFLFRIWASVSRTLVARWRWRIISDDRE